MQFIIDYAVIIVSVLGFMFVLNVAYYIYIHYITKHECVLCNKETHDSIRIKEIGRLCPTCLQDSKDWGFVNDDNEIDITIHKCINKGDK